MTNREKYFSKVDGKLLVDLIDCDNCDELGIVCRSKCPYVDEKTCDKWLDEEFAECPFVDAELCDKWLDEEVVEQMKEQTNDNNDN